MPLTCDPSPTLNGSRTSSNGFAIDLIVSWKFTCYYALAKPNSAQRIMLLIPFLVFCFDSIYNYYYSRLRGFGVLGFGVWGVGLRLRA